MIAGHLKVDKILFILLVWSAQVEAGHKEAVFKESLLCGDYESSISHSFTVKKPVQCFIKCLERPECHLVWMENMTCQLINFLPLKNCSLSLFKSVFRKVCADIHFCCCTVTDIRLIKYVLAGNISQKLCGDTGIEPLGRVRTLPHTAQPE